MTVRRLFVWLFAISLFTMAVRETLDPDMWWHLRTGEAILLNGIPRQDIFSFTVPQHEWITHEWLSQLLMWLVYSVTGLPGLIVVFGLLVGFSFWLLYQCVVGRPFLAAFVILLAAFASAIVWGARPQIFNLLLTAVFVHIVERVRQGSLASKWLWSLPFFTILWANLHSGYLLGIVLLGTYAAGEALENWFGIKAGTQSANAKHLTTENYREPQRKSEGGGWRSERWALVRQLGVVTGASFFAAVFNPSGAKLWIYPFLTLGSRAMQVYIQEWHSPDFHQAHFWPFVVLMGVGVLSWLWSGRRVSWTDLLLFLGTAAAGLLSARHIPLFAIVSVPIIVRHLHSSLQNTPFAAIVSEETDAQAPTRVMLLLNWGILIVALFVSFVWTANKLIGNEEAIAARFPVTAVDFLESEGLADARGYNSYNWGGYLIWRGIPVFVDGRADVYGDQFLFTYLQAFEAQHNWAEPLDEFDVEYVIMERGSPLMSILAVTGDWEEVYIDELAQIFVKKS